jgi:2-amino-4-hydroxy-6-hydroxymethyldihydropteridine diphosphokinase
VPISAFRRPETAYIGLGSNLEEPLRQIRRALGALAGLPETRLVKRSSLYRSKPVGPLGQPDYVNAVACVETSLSPHDLLSELQALETAQGRRRDGPRWGARTLDLDILLYGALRLDDERLTIPHPRMTERAFVLVPLREIAPALVVPGAGRVADLAARVPASDVSLPEHP